MRKLKSFSEKYKKKLIVSCQFGSASAINKAFLIKIGITHVLNAAEGKRYGQVDTGRTYYRDLPQIQNYIGFPLIDHPNTVISPYFYVAAKFIDKAINSGGEFSVKI